MTEAASYAWEAFNQLCPELKCREDGKMLVSPEQAEAILRRMGWVPPSEQRAPIVHDERFVTWARKNINQAHFSGYHDNARVWHYHHNYVQMCWLCWQDAQRKEDASHST